MRCFQTGGFPDARRRGGTARKMACFVLCGLRPPSECGSGRRRLFRQKTTGELIVGDVTAEPSGRAKNRSGGVSDQGLAATRAILESKIRHKSPRILHKLRSFSGQGQKNCLKAVL